MTNKRFLLLFLCTAFFRPFTHGQSNQIIPFDDPAWTFANENYEIVEYLGQPSLHFSGQAGYAYLAEASLLNGIVEFDVALPDQRTFLGMMFRLRDTDNYEEFYFRPHQSGNPDAYQYSPVYNGLNGWQLYHGPGFGGAVPYHFDDWMHVKLVIAGSRAEIYLNGATQPAIYLPHLLRDPVAGGVGLWGRDGYFANFRYTVLANPPQLVNAPVAPAAPEPGTVVQWEVSSVFAEEIIADQLDIPRTLRRDLRWKPLTAEASGTTNLARLAGPGEAGNTVFAKLVIQAERAGLHAVQLGYSDRARVFLNGRALYAGQYNFRDRDYRFLGTIGDFDTLFLPLERGENELLIAVSENFGGWAVRARFPKQEGIKY